MTISSEEIISRCIIYDRAFQSGIHVNDALFIFGASKDDGASHESGVLRRLAPNDADVHRIGCKIARIQNERRKNPPPGPTRKYYCGFRDARVEELALQGDGYRVELTLDGEGDEPAHVDIALHVEAQDRNERETIKTDAGLAMADAFGPAIEHTCPEDVNDDKHPLQLDPSCLKKGLPQMSEYQMQITRTG